MRGLYAIIDTDSLSARGLDVLDFSRAVIAARPAVVQLRGKSLGGRDTLALLRALVPACRDAGVRVFANDRPDLALLAGCDGVHVGQTDLDVSDVRTFAPTLAVGVSCHDMAELERALALAPDYVAFGPVFPTSSKQDPDPVVGLDGLGRASVRARARGVPLVAIGGIELARAPAIAARAELGAVISALMPEGDAALSTVTARAREFSRALGGEA
ncbi:MAG: thiamine phosphate synthase [Myxococcales bacterium]|nr:thiamine phosphate synthase [Myxococcales bacterium]